MSNARFPNDANGLVAFYNYILQDRGMKMPPHLLPVTKALMDDRIANLMVTIGPGSGKSQLLSTVYPAFRIGQDPTLTVLGLSAGEALMQGFQRAVMEWVMHSPKWKNVFPDVRPDKSAGWSVSKGMFVTGRKTGDPDANYFSAGLDSKRLTGVHAKLIIMDDLHDKDNAKTSDSCRNVRDVYYNTILGRQDPQGCRKIVAGRRWHEEDLYGHLSKGQGDDAPSDFVHMNLPAVRDGTDLYWDITVPEGIVCCFND